MSKTPQVLSEPSKKNGEFDDRFNKNYSNVKFIQKDAPFQERMLFDVYRRETKMERYNLMKQQAAKKIPIMQKELTFQRLIKDGERRQLKDIRLKDAINHSEKPKTKITAKQIEEQYKRFMEYEHIKNKTINEKKKIKEFTNEIEIIEATRSANKGNIFQKGPNHSAISKFL